MKKILIVDDQLEVRELVEVTMQSWRLPNSQSPEWRRSD